MKQLRHAIGVLVFLEQREILADQPVGEVGDEAYLRFRKALMMERSDLCEVSQIPPDGPFGVVRLLLNLGEGVCLEIQLENLRLMRETGAHVVFRPARHHEIPRLLQRSNVAFHRGQDSWLIRWLNLHNSARHLGHKLLGSIGGSDAV